MPLISERKIQNGKYFAYQTWETEESGFRPQQFGLNPNGIETIRKNTPEEATQVLQEIHERVDRERETYLEKKEKDNAWLNGES